MASSTINLNKKFKPTVDVVSLANAVVLDPQGRQLKVGHLWNKNATVLVFLRHFACIACRAHAVEVWADRERYEKTGAKIVFIGNGAPEYIDAFKNELGLQKALILTDPTLVTFKAAGLRNGILAVVTPKSVVNMAKLAAKGHVQKSMAAEGTHWQLGGVVALNKDGKVIYHYVSESVGDLPNEGEVEALVESVDAEAPAEEVSAEPPD